MQNTPIEKLKQMKIITVKDVLDLDIFQVNNLKNTKIKLRKVDKGYDLEVKQMYDYIEIDLEMLKKLSKLFGTDNVNISDISFNGCETCDFGSSYERTFEIRYEERVQK